MKDPDWTRRATAAQSLGSAEDPRAVPVLLDALTDDEPGVQRAVDAALARIGAPAAEPLLARLETADDQLFQRVGRIFVQMSGDAVAPLIQALQAKDKRIRPLAAQALGEIGDIQAVEPLLAALQDVEPAVRAAAVSALTTMWTPAIEVLIEMLKDWKLEVREVAANALGEARDSRAVEPLVAGLSDREPEVRSAIIEALGKIGGESAGVHLADLLAHSTGYTQEAAAEALLRVGQASTLPLMELLRNKHPAMRAWCARMLGQLEDRRAVDGLTPLLSDGDAEVREAAAEALSRLAWRPQDAHERALQAVALQAWDEAAGEGAEAVDALVNALADFRRNVRAGAAKALGQIGSAAAVEPLIGLLDDKLELVAVSAATALGEIGDSRAVEPLVNALEKEAVRSAALMALAKIGGPRTVDLLTQKSRSEDEDTRRTAIEALDQIKTALCP